ncbi:MAG: ethanolamine utilization microcompartment shell protein EutS [Kiritimatiellia bacterium]|jgi:ethanolamine utilization microcompartment shell protein EutS
MSTKSSGFQLRTYVFIDQMQPQLAQFIAKDNRVYDPQEYDAAIMLELAPAMEIHRMIDLALKSTNVRLGSVVTERQYGLMQIQHEDQGEVRAAGEAVLSQTGLTPNDRAPVKILTNMVIRGIEQDHAIFFTGTSKGNMVLANESVFILEVTPAAYLTLACNEALKAANIKLVTIRPFGATGRLVLSGPEAEIDVAKEAALSSLSRMNEQLER